MRKSHREAAETRARIVAVAAEKFREDGVGATGLNGLMGAAGLTHGGFYKHFHSKDQLVAEAYAHQARTAIGAMLTEASALPPEDRLRGFIEGYLSRTHRDQPGQGCGLAALGPEVARMGDDVRSAATVGFEAMAEGLRSLDPVLQGAEGASRARVAAVTMVGAMVCARAVGDPTLSDAILRETRDSLLGQLGIRKSEAAR